VHFGFAGMFGGKVGGVDLAQLDKLWDIHAERHSTKFACPSQQASHAKTDAAYNYILAHLSPLAYPLGKSYQCADFCAFD